MICAQWCLVNLRSHFQGHLMCMFLIESSRWRHGAWKWEWNPLLGCFQGKSCSTIYQSREQSLYNIMKFQWIKKNSSEYKYMLESKTCILVKPFCHSASPDGDHLPGDADVFVFILLEFLFHLNCPWWSMHIFTLPCAFVGPVSHLQTLLATHMLFVCLPEWNHTDRCDGGQVNSSLLQLHLLSI